MTALPTSQGLRFSPNWAAIANILGAGLSAAGAPSPYRGGGWANFGSAVTAASQQWRAQQMDQERFQILKDQADRERQRFEGQQRTANQERADREQRDREWRTMLGLEGAPMHGDGTGYETASSPSSSKLQRPDVLRDKNAAQAEAPGRISPFGNLSSEQRAFLIAAGPEAGFDILGRELFKEPKPLQPNQTRTRNMGSLEIEEEFDAAAGQWREIGRGPRWQPQQDNGHSGLFGGTSMDAQSMNIIYGYETAKSAGQQTTPQQDYAYQLAKRALESQRVVTGPDGQPYSIQPSPLPTMQAPAGGQFQPQVQGQSQPTAQPLFPDTARKMTPEEAAKTTGLQEGIKDIGVARGMLAPEGAIDRGTVLAGQSALGVDGVPFTEGRQARQRMQRGIETILRAMTGAAAPESEVDRYMGMFWPSPMDDDATTLSKLQAADAWVRGMLQNLAIGRPQVQVPGGAATDYKSKYGLE